jgi:plasmid stabilization system protein ParE
MPDPTYRVILTSDALADLETIADYIRRDSPQNAASMAENILNAIDSLAHMPAAHRRVGKSRKRGSPIHAMLVRPFVVYFRIDPDPAAVHILNVRHGVRRQPRRFE